MNTGELTTMSVATTTSSNKEAAPAKTTYKSVPNNSRVLSEAKYHKVIADLETVLLEISTDGVGFNTPDGKISASTLTNWAENLRDALQILSKAH